MTLEILTSDLLSPIRHGFFTRRGGASSGVFHGLNCGLGSSDQSEIVRINRHRVADAMDVAPEDLATIYQVHSADALTLDSPPEQGTVKADAMVTATPGLALGVLTAADVMEVGETAGVSEQVDAETPVAELLDKVTQADTGLAVVRNGARIGTLTQASILSGLNRPGGAPTTGG